VDLDAFQQLMTDTYGARDAARGRAATIAWLAEEVGELAQAVRKGDRDAQLHELGDVLAWLASLASQLGVSLNDAVRRYTAGPGCPVCHSCPCVCMDCNHLP
jgi:NTP pyrophosphatase (non-canonical NTP hydrolase)